MQLRHLIKKLLVQIAFISPLSGGINKNHQHETETLQGRLLSSFNQCADFPMISFDLEFHAIDECVKLSASAIISYRLLLFQGDKRLVLVGDGFDDGFRFSDGISRESRIT